MIIYHTDNTVSHAVARSFELAGHEPRHIKNFDQNQPGIFYGILRGCGMAMRILKSQGIDFWYVDNGYFDAVYMDAQKWKDTTAGKYRIVKNGMLEQYRGGSHTEYTGPMRFLVLPPSPYTAFMHDTTPEDWLQGFKPLEKAGNKFKVRDKSEQRPLNKQLAEFDALLAFNSMGVMTAINTGLPVYDTHGILRNDSLLGTIAPYYDMEDMREFYMNNNFTLDEIAEGKWIP